MGGSILLAKRGSKVMAIDRWPHLRDRTSATLRATMSVPPPGAYPTMSVTGRVGNSLACATGKNDKSADHKPRDWTSDGQGKSVYVRVELGGRRIIKITFIY